MSQIVIKPPIRRFRSPLPPISGALEIEVRDFKSFAHAKFVMGSPVTFLVGPNGSGKSNLIEALDILRHLITGGSLSQISEPGKGGQLEIRGDLDNAPRKGAQAKCFGFTVCGDVNFSNTKYKLEYTLEVSSQRRFHWISKESLYLARGYERILIFDSPPAPFKQSELRNVSYNNFARGGNKPLSAASNQRSLVSQYGEFASSNNKGAACAGLLITLRATFRLSVFDPMPRLMRDFCGMGDLPLRKEGQNVSAVLYDLSKRGESGKESLQRVLTTIAQLPDEPFTKFEFVEVEKLHMVMFALARDDDAGLFDARLLSDGTLRTLAILTALETAPARALVIVEEFDNGIHPSRLEAVTHAIWEIAKRRDLRVMVTTHNPTTLNALTDEMLHGVTFSIWDGTTKAHSIRRLEDLPRCPELLEQGRLGDLVTRRVVERYSAPGFEDQRRKEIMKWFTSSQA